MPHELVIWCNAKFADADMKRLIADAAPHRVVQANNASSVNLAAGSPDPLLAQADAAYGQPDPEQVMALPRLKWVQLTTAGYTRYDTERFRAAMKANGTIFCNASSVYSEPCAQHVLAMMLALSRQLPQAMANQWTARAWPYLELRSASKLLNGQTVVIVGYGAIGRRLAELLAPFNMHIVAFRRRQPPVDNAPVRLLTVTQLDEWLPKADHVVNVLPASNTTEEFFNANRFPKIKREAFYYNIGRGSTNDEYALRAELETGRLAAAYIDATMDEPLPPDHPLWSTPNCYITPHTAGGDATENSRHVDLFLENLKRLQSGVQLLDRII